MLDSGFKYSWILNTSSSPTYKLIYSKHFCEPQTD